MVDGRERHQSYGPLLPRGAQPCACPLFLGEYTLLFLGAE